jgi:hypothetical protein
MDIEEAVRFVVVDTEKFRSKQDLDMWCGDMGRKKLYLYVERLAPIHWKNVATPENSVRFYYQQMISGYKIYKGPEPEPEPEPEPKKRRKPEDMRKCFTNRQRIRHTIGNKTWTGIYDSDRNKIIYEEKEYKSLSAFAKAHYSVEGKNRTANGWKECKCEVDGRWISTYSLSG